MRPPLSPTEPILHESSESELPASPAALLGIALFLASVVILMVALWPHPPADTQKTTPPIEEQPLTIDLSLFANATSGNIAPEVPCLLSESECEAFQDRVDNNPDLARALMNAVRALGETELVVGKKASALGDTFSVNADWRDNSIVLWLNSTM